MRKTAGCGRERGGVSVIVPVGLPCAARALSCAGHTDSRPVTAFWPVVGKNRGHACVQARPPLVFLAASVLALPGAVASGQCATSFTVLVRCPSLTVSR